MGQIQSPRLIVAWGNVLEASILGVANFKSIIKWWRGARTPETIVYKSVTITAKECTLRLPFRDLSQFKSILYKNGRGLNPETIVEQSVTNTARVCTLRLPVWDSS